MTEDKKQEAPWMKSVDGVVEVYANNIHLVWTLDDVRIRLAQLVDNPEKPAPTSGFNGANVERAAVTMPWRTAKMLRDQLTKIISAHESVNGEIKVDVKLAQTT
jgi:hypothetical protein